jgi:TRAP transporter TAXI family solute receptor
MKKVLTVSMFLMLAFALVACGGQESSGGSSSNDSNSSDSSSSDSSSTDSSSSDSGGESAGVDAPTDITFGAATQGGFWYGFGGAISDEMQNLFPDSRISVIEGGGTTNVLAMAQGEFTVGFTNGQVLPVAFKGEGDFEKVGPVDNVKSLAVLYPNVMQIAVRADSDIYSIEDLKGKSVSPGVKGYSGEILFRQILDIHGMSYDDLDRVEFTSTADAVSLIRDGNLDAYAGVLITPVSSLQELDTTSGMRLIPLPQDTIKKLNEINAGYLPFTVEAGTYSNIKEDVDTVAAFVVLIVDENQVNDEMAYEITKMMVEKKDTWTNLNKTMAPFDAEFSVKNMVGDLHPGAEKYYKEVGAIK